MIPKQPKIGAMYDKLEVYSLSGTRTATGGFTETETLQKTIWADVKQKSGSVNTDDGRREFFTDYEIITRKAAVSVGQILKVNGDSLKVVSVVNINKAQDIIKTETVR